MFLIIGENKMLPQIILMVVILWNVGYDIYHNGEKRTRRDAMGTFIDAVIIISLLWWGGFWG